MKSRRRNIPDDNPSIFRRKTRSVTLRENSYEIPIDLVTEILSRLPYKSIARFRCVSKLWASILRRPDFTELFLTRSPSRPQLLFACQKDCELFFFSTPEQPQNPKENSSPLLASYLMKISFDTLGERIRTVRGLVFLRDWQILNGRKHTMSMICNPITRECLTLPEVETSKTVRINNYFGYDPVEKQHKVLFMNQTLHGRRDVVSEEHRVLTLGTRKPSWRIIKCCIPHFYKQNGICINGVLYFSASTTIYGGNLMIVCFDVRTEKFRAVGHRDGSPINYNGKLGVIESQESSYVSERTRSFKLCILEDVEKGEWSEHTYELSNSCKKVFENNLLVFLGVTRSNELVLSPYHQYYRPEPFFIYYYSLERNTAMKVRIQGLEAFEGKQVCTFVENLSSIR
ncbi:unnamed protein product [Cochlearia groenlandica]